MISQIATIINMKSITCNKCGTVAMQVSRKYAEDEVRRFNTFFDTLEKSVKEDFYGGRKSSLRQYLACWCGNNYKNFRDAVEGDCPEGCTLSPIIDRKE